MIALDIVITWTTIVSVAFSAVYALNRPWRASWPARALFTFSLIVAAIMLLVWIRIVLAVDLPEWTRVAVYALVGLGSTFQLAVLLRTRRLSRKG